MFADIADEVSHQVLRLCQDQSVAAIQIQTPLYKVLRLQADQEKIGGPGQALWL